MLRLLRCSLIVCSLGLNLWLGLDLWRRGRESGTREGPFSRLVGDRGRDATPEPPESATARDPRLRDPLYVLEKLRREGYPPKVVEQLVWAAMHDNDEVRAVAQSTQVRGPGRQAALERRAEVLIPMYQRHTALFPETFEPFEFTFGDIPDVKKWELQRLNLVVDIVATGTSWAQEFERRAREVLSKEEADEVFRYKTPAARYVQGLLKGERVDEETFNRLMEQAAARSAVSPPGVSKGGPVPVFGINLAPVEVAERDVREVHRLLGEEKFFRTMDRIDPSAASADRIFREAGLAAEERLERFVAGVKAHAATRMLSTGPQRRALAEEARRILVAGLTPAQVEAFDRSEMGSSLALRMR